MSEVAIQKVKDATNKALPVFEDIAKRFDAVRQRAQELFDRRGELGDALADWLKAEREVMGWAAAEMSEKGDQYEVQLTLPGFDAKEIEVTATPTEVIVHASTSHEKKTEEGKVLWTEFGSNDVCRRFELPQPIDVEKVAAKLEKGLLRITAPKAGVQEKQISVAA
jgi:HSP20 family molecular chaperone IbpA